MPELEATPQVAHGAVVPCRVGQHERRAARLGELPAGSWVRVDAYLGADGVWANPTLDDCVRQADERGRVMVTLLDNGGDHLPDVPNVARYTAGIEALAARYRGQVDAWEVWNEPQHPLFWPAAPDPEAYARLLAASYPAVKRGDPAASVVAAGTSSVDLAFTGRLLAAGAPFDVMGAHPYEEPLMAAPGTTPVGFAGLAELRCLMLRHGRHEPIWLTEYGWPGGIYLAESAAWLADHPLADVAFSYDWSWL